ncbi:hypothetical protein EDC94DRAFT_664412 [Helicostylum pulchrum]|nr:hypothetical protein EDC94DRAFT_664412 [Helicostylum pulchrum]
MSVLFDPPASLFQGTESDIYTITPSNYASLQRLYKEFPLPDDIFFPWLHGVDGVSNQQNLFFRVRHSLVPNYRGLLLVHCDDEQCARLIDSVLPHHVLDQQGLFLNPADVSINLRNFQYQVARFAMVSDIVCYGKGAHKVAKVLVEAQRKSFDSRLKQLEGVTRIAGKRAVLHANRIKYKTIVIEDEFSVFEHMHPDLVWLDSNGITVTHQDFWQLENQEMKSMSKSTEITHGVWMGNTDDVPVSFLQQDLVENPNQFAICIEAHDLADMPLPSTLTLARERLNDTQVELIHIDVYATAVPQQSEEFDSFFQRLLGLLKFMQDQVELGRRVLIHCSDGYTETSLLGLCWVMFFQKVSLPEAYLYLQQQRSFFVYALDLSALRKIEIGLRTQGDVLEPEPKRMKQVVQDESSDECWDEMEQQVMATTSKQGSIYKQLDLAPSVDELRSFPWFYSDRFEGSFPSRILDFLYLGNLNHATNPEMLKALKVSHVVSVGEHAGLNQGDFELLYLDNLYDDGIDSIKTRLDQVLDFVESARLQGSICLIHCRVGVSRSAAITICYVMKYLKYTLVRAYLFVRAHRLNVIIQPNLKFMYEMLQIEQKQNGKVSITWPVLCQEIYNLNLSYGDTTTFCE